jgi:ribosome-associated heat shock protein Hsp15
METVLHLVCCMRLDLWLWAVRAFKTRPLAAGAIRGGKVKVEGQSVKPAHTVRAGQTITIRMDSGEVPWMRTLKAIGFPASRVGAKLVSSYMEDTTTPEEREKSDLRGSLQPGYRAHGMGRPTKAERRAIEEMYGQNPGE